MATLFETIKAEYSQQVFTCWELSAILENIGLTPRQTSAIIKEAIARKQVGTVSFRNVRRKPTKSRLLVIM